MSIDLAHCEGCPLNGVSRPTEPILGSKHAKYMVVTDTPSRNSASNNRLLSENATTMFASTMEAAGFRREDFLYVPQIRCPHDPTTIPTKEKLAIQKHCREHVLDDIYEYKPEVILPLGAEAARQVSGRAVKITKVRGVGEHSAEHGCVVLPMLHPGQVAMYPQHIPIFTADCHTFRRMVDTSYDIEEASRQLLGNYTFIDDLQFLIDMEPQLLHFDTETTGLEFFKVGPDDVRDYDPAIHDKTFEPSAAILTMQFCVKPGEAYMLVWDHPERPVPLRRKAKLLQQLTKLLCNRKTRVVGQNVKYDNNYLFHQTGIRFKIGGDTLMIAALLDENAMSKSQDTLVKQYVPEMAGYADHFNATYDKSRMWEVPLSAMIEYGCGDVDSGYRLYKAEIAELKKDERLLEHYKRISLPGMNTFAAVETRGIAIDFDALDAFEAVMDASVRQQYQELIDQVPRPIKRKHIDKGLKFSRAAFTLDILFYHKDGYRLKPKVFTKKTEKLPANLRVPSTSTKDHLPYFYDECPFSMQLAQYIKDERLLGTSIRGFRNKYIHDSLVRPTYSLWTAVTGRSSSENPNGQNFPKRGENAKAYRRMFIAPPGFVVLEADLSQAELRIAADMANDSTMLGIYRSGGDIHTATALITMGVSMEEFKLLPKAEQKAARQKAKAVNFGFIYGMGWRKFIGYAKTQYGVEFTEDEAQRIRSAFFDKYHALPDWHGAMREFAKRHGYVRSYSGRVRHLPMIDSDDEGVQAEAGRQAINSPVQEFASSLGIMAIGRLMEEIDPRYLAPIAFVHDAIYCYVPEHYVEWGAKTLKHFMESNPLEEWFGRRMKCPIVADVSVGHNFGDTYELEGFKPDERYDFGQLWDAEKETGILLPRQRIPPNRGQLMGSPYTVAEAA